MKYILIIFASLFILTSCEKVIDLDLNESNSQLVVDGFLTDSLAYNFIKLSKTGSFYVDNDFEKVENATVELKASNGTNYVLNHIEDGYYYNENLDGVSGLNYQLKIDYNGDIITSNSTLPTRVKIDSVTYEAMSFAPPGNDDPHIIQCYFHDPAGEDNYYRFKVSTQSEEIDEFIVTDDKFFDGIQASIGLAFVEAYDTVTVEMYCIDKANYDYFNTISDASGTDNPGNPISNIEGKDAIGYFGAYTFDIQSTVVIPIE